MRVYTFFSYTFKFFVPERKYGGEFSGEKVAVAASDVNYAFVSTGGAFK